MKILVLGAGAIGGYFGGRLAQAGADVTFLVRAGRAAQLAASRLVVKSPHGDFALAVKAVQDTEVRPEYDLVLLTCKAYDLASAIASLRPAIGARTHVMPLLNGLLHLDEVAAAFGPERLVGGTCQIAATMSPDGTIRQLAPLQRIAYGLLPATSADAAEKLTALHDLYRRTGIDAVLTPDVMLELWEKFVFLSALAAMTCLMRAHMGNILATDDGEALMGATLAACAGVATAAGHPPREEPMATMRQRLFDRNSTFAASMLRDIEAGNRIEAAAIVGDMLRRARAAGIDPGPLAASWCHLQAYEAQRRGRQ